MIKAVFFDMGGVISPSRKEEMFAWLIRNLALPESKINVLAECYNGAQKGEKSTEELLDEVSSKLNVDKAKLRKSWEEMHSEVFTLNPEVLAIVSSLKEKKYVTALITNTIELHASLFRKNKGYSFFHPIVCSYEIGIKKPEPGIYKKMLDVIGFKAEECVFVDDRIEHLAPAIQLGMKVIHFKNAEQLKQDLRKLGVDC